PNETWMEKWLMHEFVECANYYACYSMETDARIKQIWELFLNYEFEHLRLAGEAIKKYEDKDPEEICGSVLPTPGTFEENKEYVADVLFGTVNKRLMPDGEFASVEDLPGDWASYLYQATVNAEGSPSEQAVRYRMLSAGKELLRAGDDLLKRASEIRLSLDKEMTANTAPETAEEMTSQAELLARRANASGRY
ncbi:MAG TPA: hypothetical protein VEQ34_08825, partial [Pyrinomonadaceae bacterium]|nr:hypothetical protein [Pyrinomonadaceae bacterium]